MIQIDDIDITGMKKSDFLQLEEIFDHFEREGVYWGRKDYFDKRQKRLRDWLRHTNLAIQHKGIVIKEER